MAGSKKSIVKTKVKKGKSNIVESFSRAQISKKTLDINDLLADINKLYQKIIRQSYDAGTTCVDVTTSLADPKSTECAHHCRIFANTSIRNKDLQTALIMLTQSVSLAETGCAELALAYADRSRVLFELGKYESCIQDVNRATEIANCPVSLKKKLRERKKLCLMRHRQQRKDTTDGEEDRLGWRNFCNFEPPNVFSPKLKLECDEERGRYLIANEDIQPGEIISIQDFYVMELIPDKCFTHCSYCLLKCDCLIPCSTCTREMYCSENCRNNAFNSFHRSECKFIRMYDCPTEQLPSAPLAVRMFLIGTEQGEQLGSLMRKLKPNDIFTDKFDCDLEKFVRDYCSSLQMYNIVDRMVYWYSYENTFIETFIVLAVKTIIALLRTSFFKERMALPVCLGPEELFATLLLINHFITVGSYDFAIDDMETKFFVENTSSVKLDPRPVGLGICLSQNLMKHACVTNTSKFIQNRQRIVFATQPIRSGEEVSNAVYNNWFLIENLEQRSRLLWKGDIVCKCDACLYYWPLRSELELEKISFSSPDVVQTKMNELKLKMDALLQGRQMDQVSNNRYLQIIIEHLNLLSEILKTRPSYDIMECSKLLSVYMKLFYCDHHRDYLMFLSEKSRLNDPLALVMKRINKAYQINLPRIRK